MQQITVSGSDSFFILMMQLMLYYLLSLLPGGAADYLQRLLTDMTGTGIQIQVSSPLYQGWQGTLLTVISLLVSLFLLGLSLFPYVAGVLWYYRIVTHKVNELLQGEKER